MLMRMCPSVDSFDYKAAVRQRARLARLYKPSNWAFTRYDRQTDRSVRRSYRVNASSDRSDRRSEESSMFDFVRLPIRLSKRVDTTTSDWSDRPASRESTTNHAAA